MPSDALIDQNMKTLFFCAAISTVCVKSRGYWVIFTHYSKLIVNFIRANVRLFCFCLSVVVISRR